MLFKLHEFWTGMPSDLLIRGRQYVDQGKVTDLQRSPTGRWTAVVKGRKPYRVEFATEMNVVLEISCDCIPKGDYGCCKHLAAVLLAIHDMIIEGAEFPMDYMEESRLMESSIQAEIEEKHFLSAAARILAMIRRMPLLAAQVAANGDVEYPIYDRVVIGFKLMAELAQSEAPQALKERIYKRSLDSAMDRRWKVYEFDPHWMDVLMILSQGKEEEVLGIVDRLFDLEQQKEDEPTLMRYLSIKPRLLETLGRKDEMRRLLKEYPATSRL